MQYRLKCNSVNSSSCHSHCSMTEMSVVTSRVLKILFSWQVTCSGDVMLCRTASPAGPAPVVWLTGLRFGPEAASIKHSAVTSPAAPAAAALTHTAGHQRQRHAYAHSHHCSSSGECLVIFDEFSEKAEAENTASVAHFSMCFLNKTSHLCHSHTQRHTEHAWFIFK